MYTIGIPNNIDIPNEQKVKLQRPIGVKSFVTFWHHKMSSLTRIYCFVRKVLSGLVQKRGKNIDG